MAARKTIDMIKLPLKFHPFEIHSLTWKRLLASPRVAYIRLPLLEGIQKRFQSPPSPSTASSCKPRPSQWTNPIHCIKTIISSTVIVIITTIIIIINSHDITQNPRADQLPHLGQGWPVMILAHKKSLLKITSRGWGSKPQKSLSGIRSPPQYISRAELWQKLSSRNIMPCCQ